MTGYHHHVVGEVPQLYDFRQRSRMRQKIMVEAAGVELVVNIENTQLAHSRNAGN